MKNGLRTVLAIFGMCAIFAAFFVKPYKFRKFSKVPEDSMRK